MLQSLKVLKLCPIFLISYNEICAPLLKILQFFKGQWEVKPESQANLNMKTARVESEILMPQLSLRGSLAWQQAAAVVRTLEAQRAREGIWLLKPRCFTSPFLTGIRLVRILQAGTVSWGHLRRKGGCFSSPVFASVPVPNECVKCYNQG